MSIYQANHATLNELLKSCSEDANVLIPNLQRPYVWTPDQVIRLVDSMLRGWPFSTLLLWNLGSVNQRDTLIPSRPFWRLIDRNTGGKAEQFGTAEKPSEFKMVLDGQQRLQSLLLVFGAESGGLRLLDADWKTSLVGSSNLRGPLAKKRWTLGRVYLDLTALADNLTESKYGLPNLRQDADFTQMLIWAFNSADLMSRFITPSSAEYEPPLPDVARSSGRYISMAKIWKHCVGLGSQDHDSQFQICETLLEQHGVCKEKIQHLLNGFVQFSRKISLAQTQQVSFLELGTLASSGYTAQHEYNDAIVNIFTRLNSGGRTLTREEITFAWIKVSWDAKAPSEFGSAENAIARLAEICSQADPALKLAADEIVKVLSFIWSVFGTDRKGALVKDRDLLDGATVRAMANWLYDEMNVVEAAFAKVLEALAAQGLEFGGVYRSVNALAVLLACGVGHELLRKRSKTLTTDDLGSDLAMGSFLSSVSQPWFVLSQWAGEWAKGTDETMAHYAKAIAENWSALREELALSTAQEEWSHVLDSNFETLRPKALAFVRQLEIEDRSQVRSYRLALWVWNRLSEERERHANIVMRDGAKGKASIEVDHIVSWSRWEAIFSGDAESLKIANQLGNCTLLHKTFNISKGKDSLDSWISKVADFPADEWKASLKIPLKMSALTLAEEKWKEEIVGAIEHRTIAIKEELSSYVTTAGASKVKQ
ncbi:hypothetical protein hmeg3_23595 [Herbaspirillum sp. meg3]|uniref:DUF262 domain-containing protein n=1 Tax=Herbaspirillum sp. meg3 TaxID=2025949 RepID=UPI000B97E741|nr:DUF262 domain-containing protein [Herbaspirillum sp. meg3]ASU40988.1 hypothetical protein hmeg3_23595 [Herbaspirillum sp. meg3]